MTTTTKERRGKAALDAKRGGEVFLLAPEDVVIIGLDTDDGPTHPHYDARAGLPLDEERVLGVMRFGLVNPVTVRKNGDKVEVTAGRQRVKLAREANRRLVEAGQSPIKIPVLIRKGTEGDLVALAIIENEHRTDDGPVAKAAKIQRYIDRGHTVDEAAVPFGMPVAKIRRLLGLLDLAPEVQARVDVGDVSMHAAAELVGTAREEQAGILAAAGGANGAKPTAQRIRQVKKPAAARPSNTNGAKHRLRDLQAEVLRLLLARAGFATAEDAGLAGGADIGEVARRLVDAPRQAGGEGGA